MKKIGVTIGIITVVWLMITVSCGNIFVSSLQNAMQPVNILVSTDIDPLVNHAIDIVIERVRTIDVVIDQPATFSVRVIVGADSWESTPAQGFDVMNVGTAHFDIPDDEEQVFITIEMTKDGVLADITGGSENLEIIYDVKTGSWSGNDWRGDPSGYGHTSGIGDNTVNASDCEIWFDIIQNDYDGDGIPYWTEVNVFHTDPTINNRGEDADGDGVPIEWEFKWGYDPFVWDDHAHLDPDNDGLQNIEEFEMQMWFADPFRQDIYIENDYMESNGQYTPVMPEQSIQLQYSSFTKHNIMLLIDDGLMGGSDLIPYKEEMVWDDYDAFYTTYFLHNDQNNPRRGIFHYALIIHDASSIFGRGVGGFNFNQDAIAIASTYIQKWRPWEEGSIVGHGGSYMHELGHQLGLDHLRVFPWQILYWLSGSFKSCMNYRYNFKIVDYSDGTHGFMDYDEWSNLDLSRFQR